MVCPLLFCAIVLLSVNVENLTLTGNSVINGTGNALDNVIVGNSQINTLIGDDGNDTLDGGAGVDSMVGGLGNDTYVVSVVSETITEAETPGHAWHSGAAQACRGSDREKNLL